MLVGPLFVDWTDYKDPIEDYAEQALGQPVTVLGRIDVRLLPSPSLHLSDVRIGEAEDPLVTVTSMTMDAELPPLLRSEIKFKELTLEQPTLELGIDEKGEFNLNFEESVASEIEPDSVSFDEIRISNGRFIVDDARSAARYSIDGINIVGSARSLNGPFRANGTVKYTGGQLGISLATGTWQQDTGIAVNAGISTLNEQTAIEFKGNLFHLEGTPEFTGDMVISSKVQEDESNGSVLGILNGSGKTTVSTKLVNVEDLNIRVGPEERAVGIQGQLTVELGESSNFKLNLNSKQVNLDRLLGKGPNRPVSTKNAAAVALELLNSLPVIELNGVVNAYLAGMVVNGSIIQEVGMQALSRPTGWRINHATANLPGRSKITTKGNLLLNDPALYQGNLEFESLQPATCFKWLNEGASSEGLSLDPIELSMKLDVTDDKQSYTNITGNLGGNSFHGSVFATQDTGTSKKEIIADFNAELIQFEQIQELADLLELPHSQADASGTEQSGQSRTTLRLHANEVDFGSTNATLVSMDMDFEGDMVDVSSFQVNDLAGARITANGSVSGISTGPTGVLEVKLSSADLTESINLIGKYLPESDFVGQLAEQSDLYAPLALEAHLTIEPFADSSKAVMKVNGTLDETEYNSNVTMIGNPFNWKENDLESVITVNAQEGSDILQQLGIDMLETAEFGKTKLVAKLNGRSDRDLKVNLSYLAEDIEVTAIGAVRDFGGSNLSYDLEVSMWSSDTSNLAIVPGRLPPLADSKAPIDLSAVIKGTGRTFQASEITGNYAGIQFNGDFIRSVSQDRQLIKGNLELSELKIQSLSELFFGSGVRMPAVNGNALEFEQNERSGSHWSESGLKEPILKEERMILDISTDNFLLSPDHRMNNAGFRLTLRPDEFAMEDFSAGFSGGEFSGNLIVRHFAGEAGLTGTLVMDDVDLGGFFQERTGQPLARGKFDLVADFESTGRSVSSLVKGLNGSGTFSIENGEYSKMNMEAFELLASETHSATGIELKDVQERFSSYLDKGSFEFGETEGNLTISAGRISTRNVGFNSNIARITANGTIDLNEWDIESDWTISSNFRDEFNESVPKVDLKFKGAVGNVERSIDVSRLANYLTIRALEIENRRRSDLNDAEALARQKEIQKLKELQEEDGVQTDDSRLPEAEVEFQNATGVEIRTLQDPDLLQEQGQQKSPELPEESKPSQVLKTQAASEPPVETESPSTQVPLVETEQLDSLESSHRTEKLDVVNPQDEPESEIEPETSVEQVPPLQSESWQIQKKSQELERPQVFEPSDNRETPSNPESLEEQKRPQKTAPQEDSPEIKPRNKPQNLESGELENESTGSEALDGIGNIIDSVNAGNSTEDVQPLVQEENASEDETQADSRLDFSERVKKTLEATENDDSKEPKADLPEGRSPDPNSIHREDLKPLEESSN